MSVRTELPLWTPYPVAPTELIRAQQRVPAVLGLIPLSMFDIEFEMVTPVLEPIEKKVGNIVLDAVRFSFPNEQPFGFMTEDDGDRSPLESQRTDGLVLYPDVTMPGTWMATFDTPDALTLKDQKLFNNGMEFYVQHAAARLDKMQSAQL